MRNLSWLLASALLFAACGPVSTPAPTPDIQATISHISATMIAATLAAQPTTTPIPTITPSPSETPTSEPTASATVEPGMATQTSTPFQGVFAPGNVEGLPTGLIRIENYTGKDLVVTFEGITWTREQPVYYSWKVTGATLVTVYWGRYQYRVVIGDKTTLTGNFQINNKDKTTFKVYSGKVVIQGP